MEVFNTFQGVFASTIFFVLAWLTTDRFVSYNGPVSFARTLIKINSWQYSFISFVLFLSIVLTRDSPYSSWPRQAYHLSKFYEYIDILLVRASGGIIDLHFGFHHLTTPYFTYSRVIQHHLGWEIFAAFNTIHHILMYAFFGGAGFFRPILPWTGVLQLVAGVATELGILWIRWDFWRIRDIPDSILPNIIAVCLLSIYLVLFARDLSARKRTSTHCTGSNKKLNKQA
ncbi:hypothetical protein DPV78_004422 [Talaromyces pinophilus]|nr:hypothetical protein DPV78_004422 [Talaromyces pinophilus]